MRLIQTLNSKQIRKYNQGQVNVCAYYFTIDRDICWAYQNNAGHSWNLKRCNVTRLSHKYKSIFKLIALELCNNPNKYKTFKELINEDN